METNSNHEAAERYAKKAMITLALATLLLAGWVTAWLEWMFRGEIRHAIIRWVLPKSWTHDLVCLDDGDPIPLAAMDQDQLSAAIIASSIPAFWRGVLTCPRCMSAHLSGVGLLFVACYVPWPAFPLLPLVWATSARAGLWLFVKNESKS